MAFNLQTFQKMMGVVQAATTEAASVAGQWGSGDHVGAVTAAVQTAGAIAQSAHHQSPTAAGSYALQPSWQPLSMPAIFAFASLFAKKL